MTIEERVEKALDAMGDNCYIFCCSEAECAYRDGYTDGATEQQKIDIDKACEWLEKHRLLSNSDLAEFRKAVE